MEHKINTFTVCARNQSKERKLALLKQSSYHQSHN